MHEQCRRIRRRRIGLQLNTALADVCPEPVAAETGSSCRPPSPAEGVVRPNFGGAHDGPDKAHAERPIRASSNRAMSAVAAALTSFRYVSFCFFSFLFFYLFFPFPFSTLFPSSFYYLFFFLGLREKVFFLMQCLGIVIPS